MPRRLTGSSGRPWTRRCRARPVRRPVVMVVILGAFRSTRGARAVRCSAPTRKGVAGEGTQPGPLDARAARGVLLLPHAGRKRRDDGAEACRTRIGREQLDAGWRRVEVSWPASVCLASVASDGDETSATACSERPRANDAADVTRAREDEELRVEAGTVVGRPLTCLRCAHADTDSESDNESVALSGDHTVVALHVQHPLAVARTPKLRRRRRLRQSISPPGRQQTEAAHQKRRCQDAHRPQRVTVVTRLRLTGRGVGTPISRPAARFALAQ